MINLNSKKSSFKTILVFSILYILSTNIVLAQPPSLGTSSTFALFTAAGAFNNLGASVITGDIGTYTGGPTTGFGPGVNFGTIHDGDVTSALQLLM